MATHTIIPGPDLTSAGPIQTGLTSAKAVELFLDPDKVRRVEYTVYLHTISKRSFNQPNPVYRNVIIPACPKDKRSLCFFKINHPVMLPRLNPDDPKAEPLIDIENAKRLALGICNPDFRGSDLSVQWKEVPYEAQTASSESNLSRQGIFASMNMVPTEEELKKAEAARHAYYKFRFEEANGLERSDPKRLQEVLGLDHHLAAEMFGVDVGWHRVVTPKIDCPNCGEKIKDGIAFHYVNNRLCILDWEKSWLAGAVKKEDVPEPMQWWNEGEKAKRTNRISAAAESVKGS